MLISSCWASCHPHFVPVLGLFQDLMSWLLTSKGQGTNMDKCWVCYPKQRVSLKMLPTLTFQNEIFIKVYKSFIKVCSASVSQFINPIITGSNWIKAWEVYVEHFLQTFELQVRHICKWIWNIWIPIKVWDFSAINLDSRGDWRKSLFNKSHLTNQWQEEVQVGLPLDSFLFTTPWSQCPDGLIWKPNKWPKRQTKEEKFDMQAPHGKEE